MTRFLVFVLLTAMTALGTENPSPSVASDQSPVVTFNKDVLPILQKNCQSCHRPSGVAPMSLLTYESARPWAKAIKSAVLNKKMPPWFADPHFVELRNAPKLTQADINTLAAWADSGAREGDAANQPPAPQWADGWRIQPDVVVSMPEPQLVAARGPGEIKQYFIPNPFKEDTWVSSIEIRPGDPSVVHHVIVQVPEQKLGGVGVGGVGVVFRKQCNDCQQAAELQQEVRDVRVELAQREADLKAFFVADAGLKLQGQRGGNPLGGGSYSDVLVRLEEQRTGRGAFTTMEAVYAPGSPPLDFRYTDSAKLIPGGKPIRIEVHYTPNGKEETWDQTRIGFTLAKAPAQRRFVMMAPVHLVDSRKPIPAGDANYETRGELTFDQDAELVWFMPHMHLRGKDMTFRLIYPNGKEQTVLSAKFNFNWQLGYEVEDPIKVPKGTRMVVTAHHDNSANNPSNPAPGAAVPWGEMTAQEMMLPWFGVVVEGNAKPEMIASYRPADIDGPFPANLPRVNGQRLNVIAEPFAKE